MKEALFSHSLDDDTVQCMLCPHHCIIPQNHTGRCKVRKNIHGTLYSLVYNHPIAQSLDPIEKKPLYHFYPGSTTYSIATVGCNLDCKHCQNADISQAGPEQYDHKEIPAETIVNQAQQHHASSIAYTYTEPTIFYEYAQEICALSHKEGLKNVFVTNGYIDKEPLEHIVPFIDAANIDLKAMSEEFYKTICSGHLTPVLDAIKLYHKLGIWIEITTLFIPGYNDDKTTMNKIAQFIADIDVDIPWHVTGFHPMYKLTDVPPTSVSTLEKATAIGKNAGLHYIYQGNRGARESTICPSCGTIIITRSHFTMMRNETVNHRCPSCGTQIKGVGI